MSGINQLMNLAALEGIVVKAQPVVKDWFLLNYDIPAAEQATRIKFLNRAIGAGAVQFTESCYLMPATKRCQMAVLDLLENIKVKAYIWTATPDEAQAEEITNLYDGKVLEAIDDLEKRVAKITKHVEEGHGGQVDRMLPKTCEAVKDLVFTVGERGSAALLHRLMAVQAKLLEIYPVAQAQVKDANLTETMAFIAPTF